MAAFTAIQKPTKRVDGERKVTGAARYAGDVQLPGMLHARLVLSQHPHARIMGIAREEASRLPGVVGIFTAADLDFKGKDNGARNRRPLAADEVVFEGQPIVIVIATSVAIAQDAVDLVEVDYEELEAVTDAEAAMLEESPLVRPTDGHETREEAAAHSAVGKGEADDEPPPPNAANVTHYRRGDVDAALAEADVLIERTYRTAWIHQAHLEPQTSVAAPDGLGGLTIWTSTQGQFQVRAESATIVGLPQHKVNVNAMEVGGGFGAKYAFLDPLVSSVAWKLQRPVSLVYTRSEEMLSGNPAPGTVIYLTTGAKKDGTMTALRARVVVESGAFAGESMGIACTLIGGTYAWPNLDIRGYEVLTHKAGSGAYRAPGAPQAAFAIEGNVDLMARELGIDPLEMRRLNAVAEGDLRPDGVAWPRIGGKECLDALAAHPLWKDRQQVPGEGVGVALAGWIGGLQPASAGCRLNEDGTLSVLVGSVDISGSNTSLAQIAAETFGLSMEQVSILTISTDGAPFAGPSGGSKTILTVGAAVQRAAQDARQQVLEIAARELEASPEDLELRDGQASVRGVPGRSISLATIGAVSTDWSGPYQPVLGKGGSAITSASPGFAAHAVRVSVDAETGLVRVLDYLAVQDVGCAINPAEVDGQIHGGVAQGIGMALYEAIPYGDDGRLLGATLMDYALPDSTRIPDIETILLEIPSGDGPFGAKGVGEPPIIPGAAAIANAIYDAVGIRPVAMPMTPPRVLQAIDDARPPR